MVKIRFSVFFKNIYYLVKIICSNNSINWNYLTNDIKDSCINSQSKIFCPSIIFNANIDKGSYVSPNATIINTSIGKFCSIGPNLMCGWGIHPLNGISTSPAFYSTQSPTGFTYSNTDKVEERKRIIIGNDVFIGANVTILDGVKIGDGAVIGAGAVVSKDIPPYAIAVGCPIQIKRFRFSQQTIDELIKINWWDENEDVLKKVEENFFDINEFVLQMKKR